MSPGLVAVKFEIFGKVQRVFFRKYTQQEAQRLGLHGWCENTPSGTVHGELEGPADKVREMKRWLEKTGSPKSRIEKAVFSEETAIQSYTHVSGFEVIRQ
ncbi:hypothetical protein VOLCADRAFT_66220 [Volvox carteri f. nagariensis]|uniref:acylphosphatase n=1 Tax=Volvox carteri f. nagariensis TaxID=3068 RepID=D8UAT7_VOLCA|nr:uncharacterized protein VOLCADRAFT_66220 [Volvox carteri f. nagariensis]EFJ43159.1 hypothetical protein VOLCADRAFT_66220 [Volvox carteri f. nagariensis]|eukprot:XP_002955734.1 hypothetical protein VOLCADRAFT_66220 [Volvox carteri f. nagariensis]